jgi:hypothetical protein
MPQYILLENSYLFEKKINTSHKRIFNLLGE